jgi:hypothetical protein
MINREQCHGCHNDFYNGPDRRCWSAEKGTMATRYHIHFMQDPTEKGAFTEVRKPTCYQQVNSGIFYDALPSFVKVSDVNRAAR